VAVVVGDGIKRRKLDIIVRLQLDDAGEEVTALQGEVLDDEVERVVAVFDVRNGDVADLVDQGRKNNLVDIIPQVRLEF